MLNLSLILLALLLVFLCAFFVAAEFSMVKLRPTQISSIKEHYGLRGRILALIHANLDSYLSACQLGITLTSLGLGWIGEPAFASLLKDVFLFFNISIFSQEFIHILAFILAFTIISFLHIVIGELVPKSLAIRRPTFMAVWTAIPLYTFYVIMYPAIWLLNCCSNFIIKSTGAHAIEKDSTFFSTEEIKLILHVSHLHGELTKDETEIIKRTLVFADSKVSKVMRPFGELVALDSKQNLKQVNNIMRKHRYSRYPVHDDSEKGFIGLVHVKDLITDSRNKLNLKKITHFMRPVLKVPDSLPAIELLQKFREGKSHFALIYGQHGVVKGFVTLDNLLHILIGYVKDEFHKTNKGIAPSSKNLKERLNIKKIK